MAEPTENKSRRNLMAGIIALLLVIVGVQTYLLLRNRRALEASADQITENQAVISRSAVQLDSLRSELELRFEQINQLGGDTASLGEAIRNLRVEADKARRSANYNQRQLRQIKEDYGLLLTQKDREIENLKQQNEILASENLELKNEVVERTDSITRLRRASQQLKQQVEVAAQLSAQDITIKAIDSKGRERDDEENRFRSRRVDQLKVAFTISDNKVAKVETKEVFLRVVGPDGTALANGTGAAGSFVTDSGDELFYTDRQSFLYNRETTRLTFIYDKGSPYPEGDYQVELYAEGYSLGKATFSVR